MLIIMFTCGAIAQDTTATSALPKADYIHARTMEIHTIFLKADTCHGDSSMVYRIPSGTTIEKVVIRNIDWLASTAIAITTAYKTIYSGNVPVADDWYVGSSNPYTLVEGENITISFTASETPTGYLLIYLFCF